jgi:hypothetical protein
LLLNYPPSLTFLLDYPPSLTFLLDYPPSLTFLLDYPPSLTFLLDYPPSLTFLLNYSPSLTFLLDYPPSLTFILDYPPTLTFLLDYPTTLTFSPVIQSDFSESDFPYRVSVLLLPSPTFPRPISPSLTFHSGRRLRSLIFPQVQICYNLTFPRNFQYDFSVSVLMFPV